MTIHGARIHLRRPKQTDVAFVGVLDILNRNLAKVKRPGVHKQRLTTAVVPPPHCLRKSEATVPVWPRWQRRLNSLIVLVGSVVYESLGDALVTPHSLTVGHSLPEILPIHDDRIALESLIVRTYEHAVRVIYGGHVRHRLSNLVAYALTRRPPPCALFVGESPTHQ